MKKLLAIPLLALALTASAYAFSPPNTYDLQIITGEGHQVTATWRSTEPSHFHCWLTQSFASTARKKVGEGEYRPPVPWVSGSMRPPSLNLSTRRLPCTPPKTYDGLAPGTYTLHVRAFGQRIGPAGDAPLPTRGLRCRSPPGKGVEPRVPA